MSVVIEFRGEAAGIFNDLAALAEHVGFFLADWDPETRRFLVQGWRRVADEEYETLTDFHVALTDELRASIIRQAWTEQRSLIELHSHGPSGRARFSPSDLHGFEDWVPHLWWRLRGCPYAALVATGESIDGLAWVSSSTEPEQVEHIVLGSHAIEASRATLEWMSRR